MPRLWVTVRRLTVTMVKSQSLTLVALARTSACRPHSHNTFFDRCAKAKIGIEGYLTYFKQFAVQLPHIPGMTSVALCDTSSIRRHTPKNRTTLCNDLVSNNTKYDVASGGADWRWLCSYHHEGDTYSSDW